ncbi:MAG: ATP-binding protein [Rhodothermales bacterium]
MPLLILLAFLFGGIAQQPPRAPALKMVAGVEEVSLTPYIEFIEDLDGTWTAEEVARRQDGFFSVSEAVPNFGMKRLVMWGRFQVQNLTEERAFYLAMTFSEIDWMTLYSWSPDGWVAQETGQRVPMSRRAVMSVLPAGALHVSPGETRTFLVRFETTRQMQLPLAVLTENEFAAMQAQHLLSWGLLMGIIAALGILNVLLYAFARERHMLYFGLYTAMFGLFLFVWKDLDSYVVADLASVWREQLVLTLALMPVVVRMLFVRHFFESNRYLPRLDRAVLVSFFIGVVALGLSTRYNMIWFVVASCVLWPPIEHTIAWIRYRQGFRPAVLYFISTACALLPSMVFTLATAGILPAARWQEVAMVIGLLFELLLKQGSLGIRIREMLKQRRLIQEQLDREHREAAARLEREVDRRTELLRQTNMRLVEENERRHASERVLQESEERYRTVVAVLTEGIVLQQADGQIIAANESAERILGLTTDQLSERTSMDPRWGAIKEDGSPFPGHEHPAMVTLQTGASLHGVTMGIIVPDGDLRWISINSEPLWRTGEERPYAVVTSFADVSGEKAYREELIEARRVAEEATVTKSMFLANMSHEIRTPMNGVIGMTSLLMETELTAEQEEYVDVIRASGESLLMVINDILDFSKIEAGRIELEHREFDLGATLRSVSMLLQARAADKGLDLKLDIDDQQPERFTGDEFRIRQIVLNLLSNAVKFTERGSVTLRCATIELPDGRPGVAIAVQDTGIGIPKERIDRLFQSFSQVDSSTTRKYGGTGLGLAISQRLARLMEGEIRVESEPQVGTTFTLVLPCSANCRAVDGLRVLIAEPNPFHARILTRMLTDAGMEVEPWTGDEAPDASCNAVLVNAMDAGLADARRSLATSPRRADLVCIGLIDKDWSGPASEIAWDGLIAMPFNREDLLALLGKMPARPTPA